MADLAALHRAACCGATCARGQPMTGPCVAGTYGAAIIARIAAAGFRVTTDEATKQEVRDAMVGYLDRLAAANPGMVGIVVRQVAGAARTAKITIRNTGERRTDG